RRAGLHGDGGRAGTEAEAGLCLEAEAGAPGDRTLLVFLGRVLFFRVALLERLGRGGGLLPTPLFPVDRRGEATAARAFFFVVGLLARGRGAGLARFFVRRRAGACDALRARLAAL